MTVAQLGADLLRLVGRRRLAGADRPHRLVGHDDVGIRLDALERDLQLPDRNGARAELLEVLRGLADADHGHEAVSQRRLRLRRHDLVGLVVVLRGARSAR